MWTATTATGGPRSTTPPWASTTTSCNCSAIAVLPYQTLTSAPVSIGTESTPPTSESHDATSNACPVDCHGSTAVCAGRAGQHGRAGHRSSTVGQSGVGRAETDGAALRAHPRGGGGAGPRSGPVGQSGVGRAETEGAALRAHPRGGRRGDARRQVQLPADAGADELRRASGAPRRRGPRSPPRQTRSE